MKKPASPRFYFHVLRRSDGVFQRYRMKKRTLEGYRQLPRTRALQRRFGKRVRAYEKWKPPQKTMWRSTLTVNLIQSGQRDHKYKHVRVTAWNTSFQQAEKAAHKRLNEFASKYCKTDLWEDFNYPNAASELIEYDEKLIGSEVVVDETKHS